jgi:hypothetical protein
MKLSGIRKRGSWSCRRRCRPASEGNATVRSVRAPIRRAGIGLSRRAVASRAASAYRFIQNTAVGIECCEISIGCVTYVGANLFARKWLIMRINSHLRPGQLRFPGSSAGCGPIPLRSRCKRTLLQRSQPPDLGVKQICSPDGAQRNPGSHHKAPRIPLRCIRAICLVPARPVWVHGVSFD